jgi:hypothetical protein
MVLTAAQTTAFFENPEQMGIPHDTVVQLQQEGITTVDDLADFDKDSLQQLADNLRRPGGRVPDPNPGAAPGATIPTPPFVFGAKSQKRLLVACNLVRYYNTVGRPITAANMQWDTVMRNFEIQWKALKDRKDDEEPDVPKISKALPVIKWTEAFEDYLSRVIGVRTIPLAYVIRPDEDVPAAAPLLAAGQPHSAVHGSIETELVARASHAHALYRDDNSAVYHKLEEATRTTQYAASIKPFQRNKDGRGAWMALRNQYAGRDKWEAEIKRQENLLHTRKWKGQSNFSLEAFISQHRNAFVSMQACAEHVQYQLPNEHSRVGFLLDAIENSDAGLQAAMASIRTDDGPAGKRNNFEDAASYLLPYDPVAKKRSAGSKRGAAYISGVDLEEDEGTSTTQTSKPSIGKTGVHLRYHKPAEYMKLTSEQKLELKEWREKDPNAAKDSKKRKKDKGKLAQKKLKKTISKLVAKAINAKPVNDDKATASEEQDVDTAISAMVEAAVAKKLATVSSTTTTTPPATQQVSLKSILMKAKNAARPQG